MIKNTSPSAEGDEPFPWHLGVFDAHCHPTDTMGTVSDVPKMKAKALTIMATRGQDQELVDGVASGSLPEGSRDQTQSQSSEGSSGDSKNQESTTSDSSATATIVNDFRVAKKIVPSFGWHPWFSHQIFDDTDEEQHQIYSNSRADGELGDDAKIAHYASVLEPSPLSSSFSPPNPPPSSTHSTATPPTSNTSSISKSNTPQATDASIDEAQRNYLLALPPPLRLSTLLATTAQYLTQHPHALLGEVGLDRAFRLPEGWPPHQSSERDDGLTPGGREGRRLSPYRVGMSQQKKVLLAQLKLAGRMGKAVSCHGVQCHGALYESLRGLWVGHERPPVSKRQAKRAERNQGKEDDKRDHRDVRRNISEEERDEQEDSTSKTGAGQGASVARGLNPPPPRICLHSYSGPSDQLKQYFAPMVPVKFYFSFSIVINFSDSRSGGAASKKVEEVIRQLPSDRILVESDMHTAGERMDEVLEGIVRRVCAIRGWGLEEGVTQLGRNWKGFVYGDGGGDGEGQYTGNADAS